MGVSFAICNPFQKVQYILQIPQKIRKLNGTHNFFWLKDIISDPIAGIKKHTKNWNGVLEMFRHWAARCQMVSWLRFPMLLGWQKVRFKKKQPSIQQKNTFQVFFQQNFKKK